MEREKPKLLFKPITDGLGFHPFSDGLPYAPVTKTAQPKASAGAGAVAAGPAVPVRPQRISVPVSTTIASPGRIAQTKPLQAKTTQKTVAEPAALPVIEVHFGFIYLLKRLLAYTFDSALNISLCLASFGAGLTVLEVPIRPLLTSGNMMLVGLFLVFFNWALIAAQEIATGTSVGKRIFGLFIQGDAPETFLRAFFFLPSIGFCGVGLLWGVFHRQRRCWHDMVVNLQPVEIARL